MATIRIKIDGNTIELDGADAQKAQGSCSDLGVERNRLRAQRVEEELISQLRVLAKIQDAYEEATDKGLTKAAKLVKCQRVISTPVSNDRAIGRALPSVVSDD